jgi:hypothetical protein
MKIIRLITLGCLALMPESNFVMAQSIGGGTITGVVKDPSGGTVPGAIVKLRNPVTSYEQSVVADDSRSLPVGSTTSRSTITSWVQPSPVSPPKHRRLMCPTRFR